MDVFTYENSVRHLHVVFKDEESSYETPKGTQNRCEISVTHPDVVLKDEELSDETQKGTENRCENSVNHLHVVLKDEELRDETQMGSENRVGCPDVFIKEEDKQNERLKEDVNTFNYFDNNVEKLGMLVLRERPHIELAKE